MQGSLSSANGLEVQGLRICSEDVAGERQVRLGTGPDSVQLVPTIQPSFHMMDSVYKTTYRRLGTTDMMVSTLGLGGSVKKGWIAGGASFGGIYGPLSEQPESIVRTALINGVNIVDVGYWYGQRRSEEALAKVGWAGRVRGRSQALENIPRKAYYLCVRVGRFELDYARPFDYRADKILTALTKSLVRLKQKCADICLLQVSAAPSVQTNAQVTDSEREFNMSTIIQETLPALQIAQQNNKIKHIGLAGYNLLRLRQVHQSCLSTS